MCASWTAHSWSRWQSSSTAISCVDRLIRILIRFASREPLQSVTYDLPGVVRVSIPWLGFDRLVEAAFEQIRMYSKSDVAVGLRMLRALNDIASTLPNPEACQSLAAMGRQRRGRQFGYAE